jgi:glycosyltransferase involved in cell wall biosynthesis
MKINLIYNNSENNIFLDLEVLKFMFKKIKKKIEINPVNIFDYKCAESSINIFFNNINLNLMNYSKVNILILEHSKFHKNWTNLLPKFDYIFTKTEYSHNIIRSLIQSNKLDMNINRLVNLGWRSPDIYNNSKKDYDEILLYCTKDVDFNTIIENWDPSFPMLNLAYEGVRQIKKSQNNIIYHDNLNSEKFHKLFSLCGVHICLSENTSYDNLIVQAQQAKSIVIAFSNGNNSNLVNTENSFLIKGNKKKYANGLGYRFCFNNEDIHSIVSKFKDYSEDFFINMGIKAQKFAISNYQIFDKNFKKYMSEVFNLVKDKERINQTELLLDNELPNISLITVTHNRKDMFRLPIYLYNTTDYPKNKIEWIIVDDSDEDKSVESEIPSKDVLEKNNLNIKYIKLDEKNTIGNKRNIGIDQSSNDIILIMDDDDYYFPTSFRKRVTYLLKSKKMCVVSSILAVFDINNYVSSINLPPFVLEYYKKISEASLGFRKSFWENNRFEDSNLYEAKSLINNRINDICEISWEENIVSLVHSRNTSSKYKIENQESNGCHFGFSEKLFEFIVTLDKNKVLEKKFKDKQNNINNEKPK